MKNNKNEFDASKESVTKQELTSDTITNEKGGVTQQESTGSTSANDKGSVTPVDNFPSNHGDEKRGHSERDSSSFVVAPEPAQPNSPSTVFELSDTSSPGPTSPVQPSVETGKPSNETYSINPTVAEKKELLSSKADAQQTALENSEAAKEKLNVMLDKYYDASDKTKDSLETLKEARPDLADRIRNIEEIKTLNVDEEDVAHKLAITASPEDDSYNPEIYKELARHESKLDIKVAKTVLGVISSTSDPNDKDTQKIIKSAEISIKVSEALASRVRDEEDKYFVVADKERAILLEMDSLKAEIESLENQESMKKSERGEEGEKEEMSEQDLAVRALIDQKLSELEAKKDELSQSKKDAQAQDSECAHREAHTVEHLKLSEDKVAQLRAKSDSNPLFENIDKKEKETLNVISKVSEEAKENNDVKTAIISESLLLDVKIKANKTVLELMSELDENDKPTRDLIRKTTKSLDKDTHNYKDLQEKQLKLAEVHQANAEKEREISKLEQEIQVEKSSLSGTEAKASDGKAENADVATDTTSAPAKNPDTEPEKRS